MIAKYKLLLEKSISASVSAIEIYNKPDFKYREDSFAILITNSWELLLKAKLIKECKDHNSIYVKESKTLMNGSKSRKKYYKLGRSGNRVSISIFECMRKLNKLGFKIDTACSDNIEAIIEIRNNSIHEINNDFLLKKKIMEFGSSSLYNYVNLVEEWFGQSLEHYNFYLMPLSFYQSDVEVSSIPITSRLSAPGSLLQYLSLKESQTPYQIGSKYLVSAKVEMKLIKSDSEGIPKVKLSNDEDAVKVHLSENDISKQYPLSYHEMISKVKELRDDIKLNPKLLKIRKELEKNQKLCFSRYLDPNKKKTVKKFYNLNFPQELIKKYDNR